MNSKTLYAVTSTTHPPCPPWCTEHWDSDRDVQRGVITSIYRHHCGTEISLHCDDPDRETAGQDILFRAERYDPDFHQGACSVFLGTRSRNGNWADLLDIPLSLNSAQAFADQLLKAVAEALTAPAETAVDNINGGGRGDVLPECEKCGHSFRPDSTPSLILCWMCDAAEAGR
jgi:hypothetical protein